MFVDNCCVCSEPIYSDDDLFRGESGNAHCECAERAGLVEKEEEPKRENGWYWVMRRPDRKGDETHWSIMYWDGDEWSVSGVEWPTYQDSDMLKIWPEREKDPDERQKATRPD